MVYESDFYTTRRPYTRPSAYTSTTPRHYVVLDTPGVPRRAEEQYSYSYTSNQTSLGDRGVPRTSNYSSTTERRSGTGPGAYNYTTERSSTAGDGPGGYSYSSTTSGRLPYGTNYRHYSYRV